MTNCSECGKFTENPKFCNKSCAATYNNKATPKRKRYDVAITNNCVVCKTQLNKRQQWSRQTTCSVECAGIARKQKTIMEFLVGKYVGRESLPDTVRDFIIDGANNQCTECHWSGINKYTGKSTLQLHHLDGIAGNNTQDNIVVLCPNCHSLTNSFGSLNNGKGRKKRYK